MRSFPTTKKLCSNRTSVKRHKSSAYECESVKAVKLVCHTPNDCDWLGYNLKKELT